MDRTLVSPQTGKLETEAREVLSRFQQKHSPSSPESRGRLPAALSLQQEGERAVRQKDIMSGKGFEKGSDLQTKGDGWQGVPEGLA